MGRLKILNILKTKSPEETKKKAFDFSLNLKPSDMLLLSGEIGAGKTTFLNGVLKGLGSDKTVISSSFSLMSVYKAERLNLIHFDFYRINGKFDFEELIEYMTDNNIVAIEWPYDIKKYFMFKPYSIEIKMIRNDEREIKIKKYE